jgi:hypothetical protein
MTLPASLIRPIAGSIAGSITTRRVSADYTELHDGTRRNGDDQATFMRHSSHGTSVIPMCSKLKAIDTGKKRRSPNFPHCAIVLKLQTQMPMRTQ